MQYRLFNYSILHNIFCFYSFQCSLFVKIQDLDFWVILCHNPPFQLQIYVKFYAQHYPPLINVNNFENLFTLLICNILQKHPDSSIPQTFMQSNMSAYNTAQFISQ